MQYNDLSIPENMESFNQEIIKRYLENIEIEIEQGVFTERDIDLLNDALYQRFLNRKTRAFFEYHFYPIWIDTVREIFAGCPHPKIIELGCGTGASSLLFALLGADVTGIELDAELVAVCNKRKEIYQRHSQILSANFYQGNTLEFSYEEFAPVDVFFSLFAFNLMKPATLLLPKMVEVLNPGGKIVIVDGNCSNIYSRCMPSRKRPGVLSPGEMGKELERLGCKVKKSKIQCGIPPFLFSMPSIASKAQQFENMLIHSGFYRHLGVSYSIVAEKV
ncbi:class I SAM-dependent methyltransferase [Desulfoluna butyratoxydans]|uniref:S-adenosyl-l-methionine-dependent methyltransferase n=1 Tax=Desulfoluna butyratoxydans TaxID=231438 RepID=A0A4U8YSU3_9BACT|nr:class I SAM-dependent methyltransferase [Desulfoluna butyratoxydans]VFQ47465.1 s-adenosyl-l-methionine-dependent methyltransferase [Desulfoluna butyratoxydans]